MKLLKRLLLALAVLLVAGVAGGIFLVNHLAKRAVEAGGSYALGVPTTLEQASIGLFSGRFSLSGFTVANPPDYARPAFLTLRHVTLELPLGALSEPCITIPALEVEGIGLYLERSARGTNYGEILDNVRRFETGGAQATGDDEGGGKTFQLRRLVIRDIHASADLLPQGGDLTRLSLSIPEIVVEGLGSEMSPAELCALLVKTVITATLEQGSGALPDELLQDLRARMDDLESEAATLIDARLGKARDEAAQAIGERLDALLKGK